MYAKWMRSCKLYAYNHPHTAFYFSMMKRIEKGTLNHEGFLALFILAAPKMCAEL